MTKIYNWGIIAPGRIAHKFAQDLATIKNARLHAVASRSLERAKEFADQYNATYAYGSYEEITSCADLDAVYIATPHTGHWENTLLCLDHGIPVLCEKPMAMNLRQVKEMIAKAQQKKVFFMEAIWTRFIPTTLKMLELIKEDAIGEVLGVKADFGFRAARNEKSRLFGPDLGGGSLLDIGIYPLFLSQLVLGTPMDIQASAYLGPTGVDEDCGMILRFDGGKMAHLHSSIRYNTKTEAFIYGEKGTIHLHSRWHEPTSMSLLLDGERPQDFHFAYQSNGYSYEAEEVMKCLEDGKTESELLPLAFSLQLTEQLDSIRRLIGLTYPADME